ncbi:hypothetical protein MIR68_005855 [Amoeboaphelidium protococcarum]|nr:hypothetical protein MIR68_005855 [Amoeboaphelidium protococcarum]
MIAAFKFVLLINVLLLAVNGQLLRSQSRISDQSTSIHQQLTSPRVGRSAVKTAAFGLKFNGLGSYLNGWREGSRQFQRGIQYKVMVHMIRKSVKEEMDKQYEMVVRDQSLLHINDVDFVMTRDVMRQLSVPVRALFHDLLQVQNACYMLVNSLRMYYWNVMRTVYSPAPMEPVIQVLAQTLLDMEPQKHTFGYNDRLQIALRERLSGECWSQVSRLYSKDIAEATFQKALDYMELSVQQKKPGKFIQLLMPHRHKSNGDRSTLSTRLSIRKRLQLIFDALMTLGDQSAKLIIQSILTVLGAAAQQSIKIMFNSWPVKHRMIDHLVSEVVNNAQSVPQSDQ